MPVIPPTLVRLLFVAVALTGCQREEAGRSPRPGEPPRAARQPVPPGPPSPTPPSPTPPPGSRAVPPLPAPLPGQRTEVSAMVGAAERAAIGDLDGDGRGEIALADATRLRVIDRSGRELASVAVPGGIQILMIADVDGDRRPEILAGWGRSREHMTAPARVDIYRLRAGKLVAEVVLTPETSRNEITALVPLPEASAVLIAYFESKYVVRSVLARRTTSWTTEDLASLRTAPAYARADLDGDGAPDLVVGRVYGDAQGVDGEAFVLGPGGARTPLPTTRGVRELAIADTDGDGQPELYLADGWHQNYGQHGRGLLTQIRYVGGVYQATLIEDTPGQFSVGRILPADVDGDGRPELVTVGSHYVRVFDRAGDRWIGTTIAGAARDVAVGDLDGVAGDEVLVLGERAEIIDLRPRPAP